MLSYQKVKMLAVDLVDDFFVGDLVGQYGSGGEYSAKTRLDAVTVTAPKRAVMIDRVNKVMLAAVGTTWRDVGAVDTVKCNTIGDFIKLLCKHAGVAVLAGEPK